MLCWNKLKIIIHNAYLPTWPISSKHHISLIFGPVRIILTHPIDAHPLQNHSELLKRMMHSLEILAFYESDDPKVFFFSILRKAKQIVFQFFPFFTSFEGLENGGSEPKITI